MKTPLKPVIWYSREVGYWLCGAKGSYAIAAGTTAREAYNWWARARAS